MIGCITPSV